MNRLVVIVLALTMILALDIGQVEAVSRNASFNSRAEERTLEHLDIEG